MTQSQPRESFPASGLQPLTQEPLQIPFAVGDVVAGKYEVTGLLGSGGMGYVLSARHSELGEMVALKFLRPEAVVHPELVERFAREARAAAKIRSEHIANVFDVGTLPDGTPYIVMEHLAGLDLADYLHQQGPLPIEAAVEYIMQACEALAAAHAHGIVHRDIKPENLFLTHQTQGMGIVKVLDFGISKIALPRGKRDLVRTQMALGSPVYMSPEQIRSSDQVDARSDVWSIGCVLFELLTGVTAFDEPSLLELSAAILEREPVPLQTLRPDVSAELEEVVLRCLYKNPDDRFQNVAELAAALYPFAPRRTRISAERCHHILKSAGVVSRDLQLASVYPPSMSSSRITTSSGRIPAPRTTTPASLDLSVDSEAPAPAAAKGRWSLLVGAALLGAGAAFFALKAQTPIAAPSAAAPASGTELPLAKAPSPITTATPARVLDLDQEASDAAAATPASPGAATTADSASAAALRNRSKAGKATSPRPARSATGGRHSRGGDDELDPGF